MKLLLRRIVSALIRYFPLLVVVLFVVFFFTAKLALSVWHSPSRQMNQAVIFIVEPGDRFAHVADDLQQQDIFPAVNLMRLLQFFLAPDFILKAGQYRLPKQASPAQVMAILDRGVSIQGSITFIEGENFRQMMRRLSDHEDFLVHIKDAPVSTIINDQDFVLSSYAIDLMPEQQSYEGWFLPDTYFYDQHRPSLMLLDRAHQAMIEVLQSEWAIRQPDLPYQSPYDALIMASLIEKETAVESERAQIAGVFVRRLNKRMRLQTDPTVIYGLGAGFDGNLRRADLRRDSPYNTYTRHGLPPTPIAMPSRAAIHAALHPASGDALYFVAKGDGSHYFSSTFEEHQRAVRRYQILQGRANYHSQPASPTESRKKDSG
ncbi:MAG: endolytic transglycosylase MltG [Pseudomonadota bacterium]|nr:endolytic transglycosylase MltG [Pseudomonadota bacterium]